jgi:ribonuclease P protein subunit RPR2
MGLTTTRTHARAEVRRERDRRQEERWRSVRAIADAVAARDGCTGRHQERVCDLGLLLARGIDELGARNPQMAWGFLLHDVGKLAVPDPVLGKPGPLTPYEVEVMRRHPVDGARALSDLDFLDQRALDVVRHHHERWDGRGYPDGLTGHRIPLWARIFAVADAVDAMTSDRPYRRARTLDEALTVLQSEAGRQFDPTCVAAFLRLDRVRVAASLEGGERYAVAATRSVASKSVRGIGPTHGDVAPASR